MNNDAFDRFVQRAALAATAPHPFRVFLSSVADAIRTRPERQADGTLCCTAKGACATRGDHCVRDLSLCCEPVFTCVACDSHRLAGGAVTGNAVGCCLPGDEWCRRSIRAACDVEYRAGFVESRPGFETRRAAEDGNAAG